MPPQKHIIDSGVVNQSSATQTRLILAKGVINPDPFTNPTDCRAGSILGAMTIQLDFVLDKGTINLQPQYVDWGIAYNINDAQTIPNMDVVGNSHLMNQVFHLDGGMLEIPAATNTGFFPCMTWRVTIKIPKAWSKINEGDTISLYYKMVLNSITWVKIKAIYKEYFP